MSMELNLEFYSTDHSQRSLQEAVVLAKTRYDETLSRFVRTDSSRLGYIEDEITRLCSEVAEQRGADPEKVEEYLRTLIEEEHQAAAVKNLDEVPLAKGQKRVDVTDSKAVEDEEEDDEKKEAAGIADLCQTCGMGVSQSASCPRGDCPYKAQVQQPMQLGPNNNIYQPYTSAAAGDPSDEETWPECCRCNQKLNPVTAQVSPVCDSCTSALLDPAASAAVVPPLAKSAIGPPIAEDSNAAPPGMATPTAPQPPAGQAELPPAARADSDNPNSPVEMFDKVVMETANVNGAKAYSQASDSDLTQVSQVYGSDTDQLAQNLTIVAEFGDVTAVNGEIVDGPPNLNGLTQLHNMGGPIDAFEAEVNVDDALAVASQSTGLDDGSMYDAIKDSYGADLSGTYYLSVSGNVSYYLPDDIVAQEPSPATEPTETLQDQVPTFSSFREFLEWDRREAQKQLGNSEKA